MSDTKPVGEKGARSEKPSKTESPLNKKAMQTVAKINDNAPAMPFQPACELKHKITGKLKKTATADRTNTIAVKKITAARSH